MELQGTIKRIGELETFASGFQKKELVLLTEEQYPQPISIELLSEKTDIADKFKVGDKVKVGINIRGREWTSPQGEVKYFNSITGWRIDSLNEPNNTTQSAQPKPKAVNVLDDEDDTLPF